MTTSFVDVENDRKHLIGPSPADDSFNLSDEREPNPESLPRRRRGLMAVKLAGMSLLLFAAIACWKASSQQMTRSDAHFVDNLRELAPVPVASAVSAGGYMLKGNGKCTNSAGAMIGLNEWSWLNKVAAGPDGSVQRCEQWCNEDAACIGYMTADLTQSMGIWKCAVLRSDDVNAAGGIVGVAPETGNYCWVKQAASAAMPPPPPLSGTYCGSETFPDLDENTPLTGTITFTAPLTFNIEAKVPYKQPEIPIPMIVTVDCQSQTLTQPTADTLVVPNTNCIAEDLKQFGVTVPSIHARYRPSGSIMVELAGGAFELHPGAIVNGACQGIVSM